MVKISKMHQRVLNKNKPAQRIIPLVETHEMDEVGTLVRSFRVGDKRFMHVIFSQSDDRIELKDEEGKTILIYTANCIIMNEEGRVGDLRSEEIDGVDRWVVYENPLHTRHVGEETRLMEGHLDTEVMFSKHYLISRGIVAPLNATQSV